MKREDLYFVLFEQQKEFEGYNTNLIDREAIGRILKLMELDMPIFISGVRRCGKSSLLRLVKDRLNLKEKQFLYVNFNDERLTDFPVEDFQKIIDFMNENEYLKNPVLFIDEIQETNGWEKWVDRIKQNYTIIITGSNSKLLSREISTILTGRSISLSLTPFTFKEFLNAKGIDTKEWKIDLKAQAKIRSSFKEFLNSGGFPKWVISDQKIVLSELYENILYRDIIQRFSNKQAKLIKEISVYLLSNIATPITVRALSKTVEVKNTSTTKAILDAFENAFLYFFINKFEYSIRKQVQNPKKIYCIDNGFPTTLGFKFSDDRGRLLENLVAIDLKRRNMEIFYFKENAECDFIAKEGISVKLAIQVAYEINGNNEKREVTGLLSALNKLKLKEGLILTYDTEGKKTIGDKKIIIMPVWKWLLNSEDATYLKKFQEFTKDSEFTQEDALKLGAEMSRKISARIRK